MLFQKDWKIRKRWLAMVSRKDFTPQHPTEFVLYILPKERIVTRNRKTIERTQRRKLNSVKVSERLLPNVLNLEDLVWSNARAHTPTTNQWFAGTSGRIKKWTII